jgi:integrase
MLQVRRWLVAFFGESKDITEINSTDANECRLFMIKSGLAEATYRRHLGRCRQLFKAAIKLGIIRGENPFGDMSVTVRADKARQFFVSRESADKLIAACPDAQWRLMVALSRYGGIRTPSETLAIKWSDINWEHNRIRIPSPKT